MTPYSGQGTAMGLEDAAVLSSLLSPNTSPSNLKPLISAYESLRKPRCEKVFNLARAYGLAWSAKDPKRIAQRNETWKRAYEERHRFVKADGEALPGSPAFGEWIETYDVFEEVRKVKRELRMARM
jgi:salicylate hydroxylase